jgi:glutaredoxin
MTLALEFKPALPLRHQSRFPATFLRMKLSMQLIVYSSFWCPDCREAKRFLARHNIPFQEVDIEFTPGAAEEVIKHTGKRAQSRSSSSTANGFNLIELAKAFSMKKCPGDWGSRNRNNQASRNAAS